MERIKFYGLHDLSTTHFLEKADRLLNSICLEDSLNDLNTVIDLFNILKYIDAGIKERWENDLESKIKKSIGVYSGKLKGTSLKDLFEMCDTACYSEFWEYFTVFSLYKNYSDTDFKNFLEENKPYIVYLLNNERLVREYSAVIKEYLLSNSQYIEVLLDKFEVQHMTEQKEKFLPKDLTDSEVHDLVEKYIESENTNLNYLYIIRDLSNKDIKLSDKIKLATIKKIEKETEKFFKDNEGHTFGVTIKFLKDLETEFVISQEKGMTELTYSLDWIEDNLDYNTLLNNFIHLFGYVDNQMRITLVNKRSEINHFEEVMGYHSKNNYRDGWVFKHKNMISEIQLQSYENVLRNNGILIENVLNWFFKEYLREEFGIDNFYLNFPSESTSYIEKCKIIAPEIESALKQFNLLVEDGRIDRDLLKISSTPLSFSNCKSNFKNKYVYPDSDEFNRICYYFFSDQSMLSYIDGADYKYKCFLDLIIKEKIHYDDYLDYQKRDIDWLLSEKYLRINDENNIMIEDLLKMRILEDIYHNEEICFINVGERTQSKIDELVNSGILSYGEGLFSKNEIHYFNFNLNKSEFGNALDLRNMYVHGCFQNEVESSELHKYNYFIFVKLLILIIIKINDELCNTKPALDSAVRAG